MKELLTKLAVVLGTVVTACGFTNAAPIDTSRTANTVDLPRASGKNGIKIWPFENPENVATFTVRQIMAGSAPILLVCRDADDGSWQFLTGEALDMKQAMFVTLKQIVERDESVTEIADLPAGWCASREKMGAPWRRFRS